MGQADPTQNGIYNQSTTAWQRSGDMDGANDVVQWTLVVGNNGETFYQLVTPNPSVGNSALVFQAIGTIETPQGIGMILYPTLLTEVDVVQNVYPYGDPRRQGCVCNGVNDDTADAQNWMASGYTEGFIPLGCVLYPLTLTQVASMKIRGPGTIRQQPNPGVALLYTPAATGGISLELDGIVIDGNQANQGAKPTNFSVDFRSAGAANNPTLFRVTRSIFLNGAVGDIQVFGNQTGGLVTMMVETSHFLGGAGGDSVGGVGTYFPRSINIGDGVDYKIQDNHFDFCASPVNTGRAGIVGYYNQAEGVPTGNYGAFGRGQISGNSFNRMGRDTTNGQGPIDVYGYGIDVTITDNVVRNFALRAINVKASCPRCTITGNVVDTGYAGLTEPATGIVCNPSTTTDFYNDLVVADNIVYNVTGYGILVSGFNSTLVAGTRQGVSVTGNIVRNAASGGGAFSDIYLQACTNADVSGNLCFGNGGANAACVQLNYCQGTITIRANQFIAPTGRAILCNAGDTNSLAYLEIDENIVDSPGNNSLGCCFYLSTVGGVLIGDRNRFYNVVGAPAIWTDESAAFGATINTTVLSVSGINSGIIVPGHVLAAVPGAASPVSVPGLTILPYGTSVTTGTGGIGTYALSGAPAGIVSAQLFTTTGNAKAAVPPAQPLVLNLNANPPGGMITVTGRYHQVDSYGGGTNAGICSWINGGYEGMEVTLGILNAARQITYYDCGGVIADGNIQFSGSPGTANVVQSTVLNKLKVIKVGNFWHKVSRIS